jgi:putative sterol carrier protein
MQEAKSPTLADITSEMRRRVGVNSGFGHTVKFDFGEGGFIYIDAKNVPNSVTNEDGVADTTVRVKFSDFCKIADGSKNPVAAFMAGRLKVSGNLAVAPKLGLLIGHDK